MSSETKERNWGHEVVTGTGKRGGDNPTWARQRGSEELIIIPTQIWDVQEKGRVAIFLAKPFLSLCACVLPAQLLLEQGKLGGFLGRVKMFKTDPKNLLLSWWDGDSSAPLLAVGFQSRNPSLGNFHPRKNCGGRGHPR